MIIVNSSGKHAPLQENDEIFFHVRHRLISILRPVRRGRVVPLYFKESHDTRVFDDKYQVILDRSEVDELVLFAAGSHGLEPRAVKGLRNGKAKYKLVKPAA